MGNCSSAPETAPATTTTAPTAPKPSVPVAAPTPPPAAVSTTPVPVIPQPVSSTQTTSSTASAVPAASVKLSEKINNHVLLEGIKVHAVVTGDLDHDHTAALKVHLSQVSDEQLIAELAERDMDHTSTVAPDYDMNEHKRSAKIPLEAATDDELLGEVLQRKLILHEEIDEELVKETYDMGKILGVGASGKVHLVTHRETGRQFACKVIVKDSKMNDAQSMSTEIEIMKRMRHQNVVTMYELYEAPAALWMILELVDGGDIRQYLTANRPTYTEAHAAQHLKEILQGVHYLHSMGVVHRDLKLENILLKKHEDGRYEVKIADFGLSALIRIGEEGYHGSKSSRRKLFTGLHEPWGTAEYEAPELLNGAYGPQADIWAVGCMLYEMLSGSKAFARREDEKNFDKLYARIRKGEIDFRKSGWWSVSANAKDIITSMINVDPSKRSTATEALNHKWIKTNCSDDQ